MWSKYTNQFETRHTATALAVLLSAVLSLPAHAADMWKVNLAKSKFGSAHNTLVLERDNGKATAQATDAKGNPSGTRFLVISNGKVYIATNEAAYDGFSGKGVKTVDYARWKGMNVVQIGDNVRSVDNCGFRCQSGLTDSRVTLTFTTTGADPSDQMRNVVVLNKP